MMTETSTAIRLNPFKGCDGPDGKPVPWSPYGRMLSQRPSFTLDPLLHAGCYYVQDSSAMFVGHLFRKYLSGAAPLRVLDLCAAPGGKTTDISASLRERFSDGFVLVSNEVMKQRAAALADNVARWGDPNVIVTSVDPAVIGRVLPSYFDVIVADVPCSGEGMFRKDPRAVEEWSEDVVELCARRQRRILADVWPALRQGGVLIYSTCTYESRENDDNLEWAAEVLGGEIFAPEDEFAEYGVRLTPHGSLLEAGVVPGEGQWAGALRKTSAVTAPGGRGKPSPFDLHPVWSAPSEGEEKFGKFIPDPDFVLGIKSAKLGLPVAEVDLETALRFLHRDSFPVAGTVPGYNIISYKGHPLGLVNNVGARCNNMLPKGRRILMDVNADGR